MDDKSFRINKLGGIMRKAVPHWTHLQGQAGVCAVMTQLLMRGHIPYLPAVDYGCDLMLHNGLKIQVKSARLRTSQPGFAEGCYRLEVRENFKLNSKKGIINHLERKQPRVWEGLADFFIFWCVDEDRFFVVPYNQFPGGSVFVRANGGVAGYIPLDKLMQMRSTGMTYKEIANELGIHKETVYRKLKHPDRFSKLAERSNALHGLNGFENRWDLLDVNSTVEYTLQTVNEEKVYDATGSKFYR